MENVKEILKEIEPTILAYIEKLYRENFRVGIHGENHIKRVYFLVKKYILDADDETATFYWKALVYFAIFHDIGRTNDEVDKAHGLASIEKIQKDNLNLEELGIFMTDEEINLGNFVIEYHSLRDAVGIAKALELPHSEANVYIRIMFICKDADGLDRTRLGDLDMRYIRNSFMKEQEEYAKFLLSQFPE